MHDIHIPHIPIYSYDFTKVDGIAEFSNECERRIEEMNVIIKRVKNLYHLGQNINKDDTRVEVISRCFAILYAINCVSGEINITYENDGTWSECKNRLYNSLVGINIVLDVYINMFSYISKRQLAILQPFVAESKIIVARQNLVDGIEYTERSTWNLDINNYVLDVTDRSACVSLMPLMCENGFIVDAGSQKCYVDGFKSTCTHCAVVVYKWKSMDRLMRGFIRYVIVECMPHSIIFLGGMPDGARDKMFCEFLGCRYNMVSIFYNPTINIVNCGKYVCKKFKIRLLREKTFS